MSKRLYVAVDFDGTIAEHEFPEIGMPVPGAFKWLWEWKQNGALLFLWTMRSDGQELGTKTLTDAVNFCASNGIQFDGVNQNPTQSTWTSSPKCYAHVYVDDAAFGCPLIHPTKGRPYVDWSIVGPSVLQMIQAAK